MKFPLIRGHFQSPPPFLSICHRFIIWLYVQDELTQFPSSFSLKLDCEKLVQEKTEMQRHYVMVSAILFNLKLRRYCND